MTEEEFAALFRLLVEFTPPDPKTVRLIWTRIAVLLEAKGNQRKEEQA